MESSARPLVLHLLTRLVVGGPTRPVLTSLDALGRRGFQPLLVCGKAGPHEEEAIASLEGYPELPVLRLDALIRSPSPGRDLQALAALRETLRRLRPRVVHTHTAKAGALGRLAGRLDGGGPLLVHTFHGHSLSKEASGKLAPAWRWIERRLLRHATDLLLTLSPGQRDEIAGLLGVRPGFPIRVQPLAFDPAACGPAPPWPPGAFSGSRRRLVFVGRGVRIKGLDHLARAHARLVARSAKQARRLEVVVVGPVDPSVRAEVEGILGPYGLGPCWQWRGARPDPLREMARADGLVLPSRSEGTPVSILEALWVGRPVLASAVGGVGELLGCRWEREGPGLWQCRPASPRGLLLPRADAEAWAAALDAFVDDPGCVPGDPLGRRAFVESVFDPRRLSRDLLELYRQAGARGLEAADGGTERPAPPPRKSSPGVADQAESPRV
ncbi:MAG: glycosyltransferase [Acidobacteriota bacterium]|nr:glycosyltransferase [Acidobacteriota bacterium]MDQ7088835.1 glycosyltransferase [Acidobacteriota bacterium]